MWVWVVLGLGRSRGFNAAGNLDPDGSATVEAGSARMTFVNAFSNGVHDFRKVVRLNDKKNTIAGGRARWSALFSMLSVLSPALLPHTPFRRNVGRCIELLLSITSLAHMHAHNTLSFDLLQSRCILFRNLVKSTFGGKKYQGGEKNGQFKAEMEDGEFSFNKFHVLTEAPFWVELYGNWQNGGLHAAEASQNVSEGAEWAKHRQWHVDVYFFL
jgi:hypothetical protein